jgi:hypothetical protein
MSEQEAKPLQATFDVGDYDEETVEGVGFEPGVPYQFAIEKEPVGKFMQYGSAKGGLYVLQKKCPEELAGAYKKHPDQFEIFTAGEINGQPGLVPGKDFDKFRPYLNRTITVAWVYGTDDGSKRFISMTLNGSDKESVNPTHPEWESRNVKLARKLGYEPPEPKSKEKFRFDFLHPGVTINAEVVMIQKKGDTRARPQIDVETIELLDSTGIVSDPQKTISDDGVDPEIKMTIQELAEGCKSAVEVIKKVKEHLKNEKLTPAEKTKLLGDYSTAITRMKENKEILA